MTQEQAIKLLKDAVTARGGNVEDYTYTIHSRLSDRAPFMNFPREENRSFSLFVQHGQIIIAHGNSWAAVMEALDTHFGIQMEPITVDVPELAS